MHGRRDPGRRAGGPLGVSEVDEVDEVDDDPEGKEQKTMSASRVKVSDLCVGDEFLVDGYVWRLLEREETKHGTIRVRPEKFYEGGWMPSPPGDETYFPASRTVIRTAQAAQAATSQTAPTARLKDLDLLDFGNAIQLGGALYVARDRAYILLFPEDASARSLPVEYLLMDDAEWQALLRQTDLCDVQAKDGTGQKAILRKSARSVDNNVSWEVYRRDGFACRYCGADKVPLTVDHLVLWEERGPWIAANLFTSCRKCNQTRGRLPYEEWLRDPYYLRVSKNLRPEVRAANEAIVATLAAIPRVKHPRSR